MENADNLKRYISQPVAADSTKDDRALSTTRVALFGLTTRQEELARMVERGLSTAEIAETAGLSANTVANHLSAMFRKTDTHSRTALIRKLR